MNKQDVINAVAENSGLTKKDTEKVIIRTMSVRNMITFPVFYLKTCVLLFTQCNQLTTLTGRSTKKALTLSSAIFIRRLRAAAEAQAM